MIQTNHHRPGEMINNREMCDCIKQGIMVSKNIVSIADDDLIKSHV